MHLKKMYLENYKVADINYSWSCTKTGHGHLVLQNLYSFFNLALFWFLL